MENKKLISTTKMAEILNISRVSVLKKIKKGQIKAEKVGRNFVIPVQEVDFIQGKELRDSDKKKIDLAISRLIKEHKETLRLLGQD